MCGEGSQNYVESWKKADSAAEGREDHRSASSWRSKGPKGKLTVPIPDGITFEQANGKLEVQRDGDEHAALHGLTRALAANAVQGVATGFTRELDIVGIGYRADVKGKIVTFTLGYSHPIEMLSARRAWT